MGVKLLRLFVGRPGQIISPFSGVSSWTFWSHCSSSLPCQCGRADLASLVWQAKFLIAEAPTKVSSKTRLDVLLRLALLSWGQELTFGWLARYGLELSRKFFDRPVALYRLSVAGKTDLSRASWTGKGTTRTQQPNIRSLARLSKASCQTRLV
jgi:hypothetical protein